jgi:choline dehydrogenase-like flavoprotein
MNDELTMDLGGRATSDLSISVLQGRALGGGGVINASDVVPIVDPVLNLWVKKFGLTGFTPEALAPFKQAALEDLSANVPFEEQINRNNKLLREGATKLNLKGEVMHHNRVGCAGVGACLIGCPLDRKKNPRFVAIPGALEKGARFWIRSRVVRIENATVELKTLRVRRLDAKGYHEGDEVVVKARHLIIAANAVATPQLLLRSGLGNEHVGRNLSLQPQMPVTARFADTVHFYRGIPQTYAVTEHESLDDTEHGWWGFRIEAISGTPGIVGSLLPELGAKGFELMRDYDKMAASLVLLPDEPHGQVRLESNGRLRIDYAVTDEQRARFRQGAKVAAKIYLAAGATEVYVPSVPPVRIKSEADLAQIDGMSLRPTSVPMLSAHQQGTVRFAPDASKGGANPEGLVYGTKDIYVFDSSGFPTSASSHTMAPILTVSRFLTRQLLG